MPNLRSQNKVNNQEYDILTGTDKWIPQTIFCSNINNNLDPNLQAKLFPIAINTSQFSFLNSTNSPWSCSSSSPDPLRILQINLGKGKVATANLPKEAKTHKIDLIIVQEPYSIDGKILGIAKSWNQCLSENGKAGIISLPSANTRIFLGTKENAVAIKI
ncbi:hypothetical protein AVEN_74522-1 [Araneus ventricosus]|uniref:Endonuclease/exonuclease/phosphatase domain-containing protein n=1 Tax=Araneus ventricosus TaxID=182803 RepID=A0A4Y2GNT4_ARAVE|nr:hypothetical protein AVEN_74522-1 [Araneus ventricosus]